MAKTRTKPADVDSSQLRIEYVPIDSVTSAPWNPRTITPEARARLKKGIKGFGLVEAFVVRAEDRMMLGGHQRREIVRELGHTEIPVVFRSGLSDARAKALTILLNNQEAQGKWVASSLASLLEEIESASVDDPEVTDLTGFDTEDFSRMIGDLEDTELTDLPVQALPSMTWVLVGIPTVRFVEISEHIDAIREVPDLFIDMVANNHTPD